MKQAVVVQKARELIALVDAPEPGLVTWHEACVRTASELREVLGHSEQTSTLLFQTRVLNLCDEIVGRLQKRRRAIRGPSLRAIEEKECLTEQIASVREVRHRVKMLPLREAPTDG